MNENFNLNEEKKAEDILNSYSTPSVETESVGYEQNENAEKTDVSSTVMGDEEIKAEQNNIYYGVPAFVSVPLTPEQEEKKDIKRLARACGFSFVGFYAVMFVLSLLFGLVVGIIIRDYNKIEAFIEEPAVMQVYQISFSLLVFTIPFIAVFKMFKFKISNLISFKAPKGKNNLYLYLLGISFCAFANVAATYASSIFQSMGFNYEVDFPDNPEGIFGFILVLLSTPIVPALVEEFACRGVIMGALRKRGDGFAILCSSVLFGLMHSNFEQIPFAFLVGLVLGFVTVKADTIWIAVAVHFTNNAISVVYTYILSGISEAAQNISYMVYLIACMLVGIFALIKLSKTEDFFKLSKGEAVCSISLRLKQFFTSVPIIIFAAICILSSFQYFK